VTRVGRFMYGRDVTAGRAFVKTAGQRARAWPTKLDARPSVTLSVQKNMEKPVRYTPQIGWLDVVRGKIAPE